MTRLGLDAAGQVRQPEGAGKWFAKIRASRRLTNFGYSIKDAQGSLSRKYIEKDGIRLATFNRGRDGLVFDILVKDEIVEKTAYEFGAHVYRIYREDNYVVQSC